MTNCNFVCSFPDYVLDRTIVIEDGHEHKISGYKLANASEFFRATLKDMRLKEIEVFKQQMETEKVNEQTKRASVTSNPEKRKRTKSLNEMEIDRLVLSYDDVTGLEYILSFIHCQGDLNFPQLEVPSVLEHCFRHVKTIINWDNCWEYLEISNDILEYHPALHEFIEDYILENFINVSKGGKLFALSFEKLKELLSGDKLNSKNDISLLAIINAWIEHDAIQRLQYCPSLIQCLRLSKLSTKDIDEVSKNKYVKLTWEGCSILLEWSQINAEEMEKDYNLYSAEKREILQYMRSARWPREAIIVVGGWEGNQDEPNFGPSRAIQIYNNRNDTWRRLVSDTYALNEGHAYSGCVLIGCKLYVVGGYVSSGPTQTLKSFDLVTACWKPLSPMHEKRNYISACCLDHCIYAIGGHNGRTRLNSVEKYDTTLNSWVIVAPMKQIRSDSGSDSFNSKVYVCGGFDGHHFYASVEIYNPVTNQWTNAAPMNNIRSGVSMVTLGVYLYAVGGNDGLQRLRTVERFDTERNRWQVMPSMIRQRSNFCVAVLENEIYVMGGWSDESNSTISLVEKWNPGLGNEWIAVQPLLMPASANCCSSLVGLNFIQNLLTS